MSQLAFTIARLGFLVLLWVFVFFVVRALRRDVTDVSAAPARRRSARDAATPTGRNRGPTRLVITEGPLAGSMVPLTPTSITIGRDQNCTLVLNDSYASSRHARVFPKDGAWWLEDLSSTNGTTLAGRPVYGAVELPVGVPVRIGQTTLELRP
ncbi:MAG: FHA domain-containing protein [Actinomyces ruminicola]|uniref:FHA domain-containing protein n=1 Tax=Actinomyces ruminicola TaxID=332524 RepID=A0A1H0AP64_9ACTO|nr:FHA domain-containing protein [Actinomyces ruminicola]MBE6481385.1 FHA domain-containing protein [Actinomyces ruminicola]SDN15254.1 FHA domain-containing protein [Actinomyces ruminicola]SDN34873.1 Inner membrane component of T3SS domain-containing protein [Actinomyces ruminicola]